MDCGAGVQPAHDGMQPGRLHHKGCEKVMVNQRSAHGAVLLFGRSATDLLVAGLAVTLSVGLAFAGEPGTPPQPPPSTEAQRLLELEAINQRKLREETQAEVESHYQAGKRLLENLEYESARKE